MTSSDQLEKSIESEVANFLDKDKKFFQAYDKIIVYYDQGQKQVIKILFNTFLDNFNNVDFRVVKPQDYYLFQVSDLTCTLEMIDLKKASIKQF